MLRKSFMITVLLLLIAAGATFAQDKANWEKDLSNVQFPLGENFIMEDNSPVDWLSFAKHPGDNAFDNLWSTDSLTDDCSGLAVADLDGDGMTEIIAADEDGHVFVFENTADNSFAGRFSAQDNLTTSQYYTPVVTGDLDGDGLMEFIVGYYNSGNVYFYEWDGVPGSDNYVLRKTLTFPQGAVRAMAVDNLDSDANQEIVIAASDTCYVYEADASYNLSMEAKEWGINDYSIMSVGTGDLNNDGVKEFFFAHYNRVSVYIYENTAEDTYANVFPDSVEFQLDPGQDGVFYQMTLTDWDNDGYPELFGGSNTGKLIVMEMQSQSWDTSAANMKKSILLNLTTSGDINGIANGDGDEDGNPDIYFVSDDDHIYDHEFNGGDFFDAANYTSYDLGSYHARNAEEIAYGPDMDGDGEKDLIVGYEETVGPFLYFIEHHVVPPTATLSLDRTNVIFDHLWNLAEVDSETVMMENIGTVDMTIDSVVSSDAAFTVDFGTGTVAGLSTEPLYLIFTANDQLSHNAEIVIYSNSTTAPDTITVYGSARPKPTLYMNEFQAKSTEWIELINTGVDTVDLTEIGFTGGRSTFSPASQFMQPEMHKAEWLATDAGWGNTQKLAPGAILLNMATTIDMNNSQDYLYLVFPDSGVIDRVAYGAAGPVPLLYTFGGDSVTSGSAARVAYDGNMATDWTGDFDATPGLANDAPAPALGSSLIINEVDYDKNVDGTTEWVEFYNPTANPIDMTGWRFGDGDDSFFVDSVSVPAGGVYAWTNSSLSISSGDEGYLYDAAGVRVDQVGYATFNPPLPKKALVGSLQRIPDGAGPNDGFDYLTSGGDVTWKDLAPTMGSLNNMTYVIFTAQIGGDSNYRSFWANGSWDANGFFDDQWSGPMLELKNDGIWPDTSATDSTFTGVVQLYAGSTYNWWVGSENNTSSFLEDGAAVSPDSVGFVYSQTCIVDPGDAGYNQWTISAAGDVINGWQNDQDNLVRDGWKWSGEFTLPAGPMEFKFTVMHSWSAAYGVGGVGGGNISYDVPYLGIYRITFDDSTDTHIIELVTGMEDPNPLVPKEFVINQNYPNPFNPSTTVKFGVPSMADVRVDIFNLLGQRVRSLVNGEFKAGYHEVVWNGLNESGNQVGSGVYFYNFNAVTKNGDKQLSKVFKMMLLR